MSEESRRAYGGEMDSGVKMGALSISRPVACRFG